MKRSYIIGYLLISLSFAACQQPVPSEKIINEKASLPSSFGLDKMQVIASSINKRQHTMSTLYGNEVSIKRARSNAIIQPGEQLILVTWRQKPDENWFGANIPGQVLSVEKVATGTLANQTNYQRYEGATFSPSHDTISKSTRINAILGIQASVMP